MLLNASKHQQHTCADVKLSVRKVSNGVEEQRLVRVQTNGISSVSCHVSHFLPKGSL